LPGSLTHLEASCALKIPALLRCKLNILKELQEFWPEAILKGVGVKLFCFLKRRPLLLNELL
jgi:hypothetical protein